MFLLICFVLGVVLRIFKKTNDTINVKNMSLLYIMLIINLGYRMLSQFIGLQVLLIPVEITSLILLIVFLYNNKKHIEILVMGLGYILNLIVMLLNKGKMPVLTAITQLDYRHVQMTDLTKLKFLSDIIYLPYPLNIAMKVSSIGDLIVGLGIILIIRKL